MALLRPLRDELDVAGVPYEVLPSAPGEAIDAPVARAIVLTTQRGAVHAVVPLSLPLDLAKIRELLGTKQVEVATARASAHQFLDRLLVDGRICERPSVVIETGVDGERLRMRSAELVKLTGAMLADLCLDTTSAAAAFRH